MVICYDRHRKPNEDIFTRSDKCLKEWRWFWNWVTEEAGELEERSRKNLDCLEHKSPEAGGKMVLIKHSKQLG